MNIIKLTIAAAALTVGFAASGSALPVGNLGTVDIGGIQADQVRLVCNRYGRCWHVGGYRVHRGYRAHRGYHRYHRRHW